MSDRIWTGSLNRVVPDYSTAANVAKGQAYEYYTLLKEAGYTVSGSCDGVTHGLDGPAVDRLSGSYDGTKWVRATGSHTWVWLCHPTLQVHTLLDMNGTVDTSPFRIVHAKLPFGSPGTGSVTGRPTSGDEWNSVPVANDGTATVYRCSLLYSTIGDYWFISGKSGVGNESMVISCTRLVDVVGEDAYPEVSFIGGLAGGPLSVGNLGTMFFGRTAGGVLLTNPVWGHITVPWSTGQSAATLAAIPGGGGQYRRDWPEFPAYFFIGHVNGYGDYKGRLPDTTLAVVAIPNCQLDSRTAPTKMKLNTLWLPFTSPLIF